MDEQQQKRTQDGPEPKKKAADAASLERRDWETPKMEDVSEQVMAQPYIRFT